jgi:molybdopterin-containing oxidoreductase family iron-sulfur binding subunit
MGIDRRNFLRLTGLASLSGLGLKDSINAEDNNPKDTKRLALIINMQKCRSQKDCNDCMLACHKLHNVPDIKETNHEVKWIWKESFEHAFPSQNHEYISGGTQMGL